MGPNRAGEITRLGQGYARRLAQYFFIRSETSCRSSAPMDFRPRRERPDGRMGIIAAIRCHSSIAVIARSIISLSAYKSWIAFFRFIVPCHSDDMQVCVLLMVQPR